ncbi:MAG: cystathionine beta-synthase [Planctomycetes bacterium]|nr:cystathionine beta-synthase [Planctomycetota bacterium]
MSKIYDSILDTIGNTPIVRLSRVGRGLDCELLGKCEFMNAGGSVKDRIGVRMLIDAEREGRIRPGDTLIEPTSGNTGIGIALAAAVRGYRVIITLPEKMSREKQVVLEALGAEIIRTPTEAAWDSPESHIGVAKRLREIVPRSFILDQYNNMSNPAAHYEGTGEEIVRDLDGKLDVIVMTAGTGGTITGVAKKLKEKIPGVRVVGVDPYGSILGGGTEIFSYKVEGIGYDFIPNVLDRSLVDEWVKTDDKNSFQTARRLIRQEGLLVGGSSGSAVWAALQVAKKLKKGQRCLALLPDSVRNYMTKFIDDKWMKDNRFVDSDWDLGSVGDIVRAMPPRKLLTILVSDRVRKAIDTMRSHGISQLPVVESDGSLAGIVTETDLLGGLVEGRLRMENAVAEVMNRRVATVSLGDPANAISQGFNRGEVALVVDGGKLVAILTKIDLIDHLTKHESENIQKVAPT